MAISYPLTFPNHTGVKSVSLLAINSVGVSASAFTFAQKVIAHTGQRWECDITLPPMVRADAETWLAWLISLRGQYGTFTMGDPSGAAPRGSAATAPGTPVVSGANQTGQDLNVSGLPLGVTGYLKAGDYVQLGTGSGSTLHKALVDVNSDASGLATLTLWPNVRSAPSDAAAVVVTSAVGHWRLSAASTSWNIDTALLYGVVFSAVEAI